MCTHRIQHSSESVRVVGWALDTTLSSRLPLAALTNALEDPKPGPWLVHHSDRGVQYLHANYVATLRKHGIATSVSRPANPGDNANCESFFRTLKREEIRAAEYANVEDLKTRWLQASKFGAQFGAQLVGADF